MCTGVEACDIRAHAAIVIKTKIISSSSTIQLKSDGAGPPWYRVQRNCTDCFGPVDQSLTTDCRVKAVGEVMSLMIQRQLLLPEGVRMQARFDCLKFKQAPDEQKRGCLMVNSPEIVGQPMGNLSCAKI